MIPWVREKFAERRARWLASRKRNNDSTVTNVTGSTTTTVVNGSSITGPSSVPETTTNFNRILNNDTTNSRNQMTENTCSNYSTSLNINPLSTKICRNSISNSSQKHRQQFHQMTKLKSAGSDNEVSIRIRSPTGHEISLQVLKSMKICELKEKALEEFSNDLNALPSHIHATDIKQLALKYRFIRPDSQLDINNEKLTVEQIGLLNYETLCLCVKRTNHLSQNLVIHNLNALHGPDDNVILQATRHIEPTPINPRRTEIKDFLSQSDMNFDVRKVIISLAQSSAYIIGCGPYAPRLISMLKQKLANKHQHQNDTLQCLVDMGFSREKAIYALKLTSGQYSAALDWLIEHQSKEISITEDDNTSQTVISSPSSSTGFVKVPENDNINNSMIDNVQALLEIIRIYSHRDIPPPLEAVTQLTDMGFSENDALKALRLTRNNQSAACEWLCGNRTKSLTELRDGLSIESPILNTLLESPQVQMSLGNPKMFIAYISMLENHNALSMWLGDSDTSSVLAHILRKYHEEKHILGINQFNSNINNFNSNVNR